MGLLHERSCLSGSFLVIMRRGKGGTYEQVGGS